MFSASTLLILFLNRTKQGPPSWGRPVGPNQHQLAPAPPRLVAEHGPPTDTPGKIEEGYPGTNYQLLCYPFQECVPQTGKCYNGARKTAKHLIKCMANVSLLVPEFKIATTAALPQKHLTDLADHCHPHTAQASKSSFTVMWIGGGPCILKPLVVQREGTAHPQEPDASEVRMMSGRSLDLEDIIRVPFQSARNKDHHRRSDPNSRLRRI